MTEEEKDVLRSRMVGGFLLVAGIGCLLGAHYLVTGLVWPEFLVGTLGALVTVVVWIYEVATNPVTILCVMGVVFLGLGSALAFGRDELARSTENFAASTGPDQS